MKTSLSRQGKPISDIQMAVCLRPDHLVMGNEVQMSILKAHQSNLDPAKTILRQRDLSRARICISASQSCDGTHLPALDGTITAQTSPCWTASRL